MPRYDMLAVDLDGTLLGPDRQVSAANLDALRGARDAGLRVVVCTGRGLVECREVLHAIEQREPVAVAGGSMVACPTNRTTLHRFALDPVLVGRATRRLLGHGHPVMVLKDPVAAGYDYLMVIGEDEHAIDPVTKWWFERMNVSVRYVHAIEEDEHPDHSVRLGVCGLSSALATITADLMTTFGAHANMHHFPAVMGPEHAAALPPGENLHILEVFDSSASKWSAIRWLADKDGIATERIAAIGDEINDLPMIRGAGLGVAMGNAVPSVREAAGRHTLGNDADGVAHAVRHILDGRW